MDDRYPHNYYIMYYYKQICFEKNKGTYTLNVQNLYTIKTCLCFKLSPKNLAHRTELI